MAFLLDTNAWIVFLKGRNIHLRNRLNSSEAGSVFVCSVVKAELYHGATKYLNSSTRRNLIDSLLAPYPSLAFDDRAAEICGKIRNELELRGQVIGPYDLMIGSLR